MNIAFGKAVFAGVLGTVVMTIVGTWVAPMMGIPPMNPANMLAGAMGGVLILGWIGHFMIGTILALTYAAVAPWLPGPSVVRGALYGDSSVSSRADCGHADDGDAPVLGIRHVGDG